MRSSSRPAVLTAVPRRLEVQSCAAHATARGRFSPRSCLQEADGVRHAELRRNAQARAARQTTRRSTVSPSSGPRDGRIRTGLLTGSAPGDFQCPAPPSGALMQSSTAVCAPERSARGNPAADRASCVAWRFLRPSPAQPLARHAVGEPIHSPQAVQVAVDGEKERSLKS